ncbi:MAG: TonB-dependent receptor [Zoogloeaceae bacterium]|jgi:iron complex outermembrane receptor protein|nr:TonB-dependent receptor [Zoogloeaceae bacterium]
MVLLAVALGGLGHGVVHAQNVETQVNVQNLDVVVISGKRQEKIGDAIRETAPDTQVTLDKESLEKFVGVDSAVTGALAYTPGVFSGGGDSSGVTEGFFTIRGFSQDQVGITRDGVPVNDPQYGTPHADFFGDPENYGELNVLYGSASNSSPALTASGGTIRIGTVAPTETAGLLVKQTLGSNQLRKTFVRANTGEHNGLSAWVSVSRTLAELWTDDHGDVESNRYESNLQYRWGNGNRVNAVLSAFTMRTNSYFTPTLEQYRSQSYKTGYPEIAYPTQGGTNGVADVLIPVEDNAPARRADFKIQTLGVNGLFNLAENLSLKVNPYYVRVTDGTASILGMPLGEGQIDRDLSRDGDKLDTRPVIGTLLPTQYRIGGSYFLDWDLNPEHTLQLGLWHDLIRGDHQIQFQSAKGNGKPAAIDGSSPIRYGDGGVVYLADQKNRITTHKLWLQDTWTHNDWTVVGGLAWQRTKLESEKGRTLFDPARYERSASYHRLLPSLKASWRLDAAQQLFYSATSNVKMPLVQAIYSAPGSEKQKPETAFNQELGWRYGSDSLLLSAALFLNHFKDRQVSTSTLSGVTTYVNAGGVRTHGLELSANSKFAQSFNAFGSITWTHARQRDDYVEGTGIVTDTRGKQLFNTPKILATAGVGYDNGQVYANLLGRYVGSFYGDLHNREKISGYAVFDLKLGYRLKIAEHSAILRVNVNNLFDKHYLSGVSSGVVSADYETPAYYRGTPRTLVATLSFDF